MLPFRFFFHFSFISFYNFISFKSIHVYFISFSAMATGYFGAHYNN